jgi:hypothetical protein
VDLAGQMELAQLVDYMVAVAELVMMTLTDLAVLVVEVL